jgi:hypothetical protein
MVGSSYSVAERRAGVEPARPNFTSAIDAEDPTTELSATARTAPPFMTFHGCRSAVGADYVPADASSSSIALALSVAIETLASGRRRERVSPALRPMPRGRHE